VAGREFVLTVGLSPEPQAHVTGGAFDLPRPTRRPYRLEVQLLAHGFDLRPGEQGRIALLISQDDLYPTRELHLTAHDVADPFAELDLTAIYVLKGHPIGAAIRTVRVLRSDQPEAAPGISTSAGANITVPAGDPPADVVLTIKAGIGGVLTWTVDSPLRGVALSADEPPTSSIGPDPQAYAANLVKAIQVNATEPGLDGLLRGFGVEIHDAMPVEVRNALASANAAVAPRALNVLILTDEPYVPWELAQLDEPFEPAPVPNHLGAQANVARWVLAPENMPTVPPDVVHATTMAVVWGVYTSATLPRLLEAEGEAGDLQDGYRAESIDAVPDLVDQLLNGHPAADILHFAVHGRYDPNAIGDGIYLTKGRPVSPTQIRGGNLRDRAPFVFLNACQVGSASQTLGGYGGIAQAFLRSGASAVVAPLWSINDKVARSIALEFYQRVLDHGDAGAGAAAPGASVAELLRLARRKAITDEDPTTATYLAYQFYGHPSLRLTWQPAATEGAPHG
jgi:hypothetical protein